MDEYQFGCVGLPMLLKFDSLVFVFLVNNDTLLSPYLHSGLGS